MKFILYTTSILYLFLPFQFALNPTNNVDLAIVRIIIFAIICIFLAYSLYKKNIFIPQGWIAGFFLAFLMWCNFSLFYSPIPAWTIRKLLFLLSLSPLVLVLVTLFIKISKAKDLILKSTVIGATLIAFLGIMQFILQFIFPLNTLLAIWTRLTPFFLGGNFSESVITHNSWLVNVAGVDLMRAVAFFPDPHIFAFYLGIILPISIALFFVTKHFLWIITFIILLIADLLTFSRGAYIGLFSGLITTIIFLWPQINTKLKHLITILIITFVFILLVPQNPITNRFISSFNQSDNSNVHRIELWTQAMEYIFQKPFIGTGLGAYSYAVDSTSGYRKPFYVHNLALDITVELGIIGLILFFGIFISLLITLFKNKKDKIALFSFISLIIFLTHSLFDTPIFSVHIFPILLLFVSIGIFYENTNTRIQYDDNK